MKTFFVAVITFFSFIISLSYSGWTSMQSGSMSGVTYASGTIYNAGTMCPSNVNQGYVCDGRNFGDKYLDAGKMSTFCSGHLGSSRQYGFGHGVTSTQKCGECAQLRVQRKDGTYNYMTVMMVDHFTWSMEVGTTEIAYLVSGTNWVVGDRATFDFRIVGNYDCYASFDDDNNGSPTTTTTRAPTRAGTVPTTTTTTTTSSGGGSCGVMGNWGSMKINPYWGSSTTSMYAMISNPPATITSFEIKGANSNQYQQCVKQNTNAFQCSISGGGLTEPASVRINGGTYYGINIIQSMTGSANLYPLTACNKPYTSGTTPTTTTTTPAPTRATVPTTTTTRSPTIGNVPTTTTRSPTRSGGGVSGCLITNRAGSSSWWYSVAVTGCGVDIDSVYLKGSDQLTWTEGEYKPWSGGYYVFTANAPYNGPISFKIRAGTGQEIISNNIVADTTPNRSGRMDSSFSSAFSVENEAEDNGISWTVIFAVIICCLVLIGGIVGCIFWWRAKRKRGKAYFANSTDNKHEHDTAEMIGNGEHHTGDHEMIVEAEIDEQIEDDGEEMITATND